jgi:hypothetical protein
MDFFKGCVNALPIALALWCLIAMVVLALIYLIMKG